ncbi:MAG TPA: helix-turn-helix domain-containing protein [Thermoanaerobaculia bacterium]|nr:helix-turn-helix domain-containing protein [Thermoanaerobaculia bacterium]
MDTMTLAFVGAAYGTSIALGSWRRGTSPRSYSDRWLAAFLFCGVAAIVTITLQHRLEDAVAIQALERIEYIVILTTGPMLLRYIRSLHRNEDLWPGILHFTPALAVAAVPGAAGLPIALLVLHQVVYTGLAMLERLGHATALRDDRRTSLALLFTMVTIHAAQITRMASVRPQSLTDIVPVTISLAMLSASAFACFIWMASRTRPRRIGRRDRPATVGTTTHVDCSTSESGLLERIETVMRNEHLYRRNDLGLHDLAAALDVTPHQLSMFLNRVAGTTLLDLLTRFRLEDATRRLCDPGHEIYTIEAIGEKSGFGSRSSFHSIFRNELGTTPGRFRTTHRSHD